tara:strand:- start:8264 stop:8458 length:195 start_codon:yes stop_codon:yes gene_type:complete
MDTYWASKLQNYLKMYKTFNKEMIALNVDIENLNHLWFHFIETTCDCEGCREDNQCVITIDFEE